MNLNYLKIGLLFVATIFVIAVAAPEAYSGEKIFKYDDQYVRIEAGMISGGSKGTAGIEVLMTPMSGWKLLADNSSSIKPLRLKLLSSKCLQLKDATQFSPPDLSGTDDSGVYSEYFTKTATLRQEFSLLKCLPKSGLVSSATLTYLLCQNNKCVGPFSREIKFKVSGQK